MDLLKSKPILEDFDVLAPCPRQLDTRTTTDHTILPLPEIFWEVTCLYSTPYPQINTYTYLFTFLTCQFEVTVKRERLRERERERGGGRSFARMCGGGQGSITRKLTHQSNGSRNSRDCHRDLV